MKRRRQLRPEASIELRDAAEWYEEQREGLGGDLVDEFERTHADIIPIEGHSYRLRDATEAQAASRPRRRPRA